jgi:hypothetical protein
MPLGHMREMPPPPQKFSFSRNIYNAVGLKNKSKTHLQENVYNMH